MNEEDRNKSNLNIKKKKARSKKIKSISSSRKASNDAKISGANIIFGLDNRSHWNDFMHRKIS